MPTGSNKKQCYGGRHHIVLGKAGKLFLSLLKENISSRFASSSDVVSDMSIFHPRKVPGADSPDLPLYGEQAIRTLLAHYGTDKLTETLNGEKVAKAAIVTSDIITELENVSSSTGKKAQRQHEFTVERTD